MLCGPCYVLALPDHEHPLGWGGLAGKWSRIFLHLSHVFQGKLTFVFQECVYCEDRDQGGLCAPYKEDDSDSLGLSEGSDAKEEGRPTLSQAEAGHT